MAGQSAHPVFVNGAPYVDHLHARAAAALAREGIPFVHQPDVFTVDGAGYRPTFWLSAAHLWLDVRATWEDVRSDSHAKHLAQRMGPGRFFYARPHEVGDRGDLRATMEAVLGSRLQVTAATPSGVASAVWSRCLRCGAGQPWQLREAHPCGACGALLDACDWWDGHYDSDLPHGLLMPNVSARGHLYWPEPPPRTPRRAKPVDPCTVDSGDA